MTFLKSLVPALFILPTCLLISCVSKREYESIEYELPSLEKKYSDLEDSYNSLNKKYETLVNEYNDIVGQYNSLVEKRNQFGARAINQRYGYDEFHYSFKVRSGLVSWSYNDTDGHDSSGSFGCNHEVSGETIMSDCVGVVYWDFAANWLWEIERSGENNYNTTHLKWAKDALKSSYDSFSERPDCSQDARQRVKRNYEDLNNAMAAGGNVLWDKICRLSFEMGEYPLSVENLYNYDF